MAAKIKMWEMVTKEKEFPVGFDESEQALCVNDNPVVKITEDGRVLAYTPLGWELLGNVEMDKIRTGESHLYVTIAEDLR